MDTVAPWDVPPPVLGFDGGISLVITVKMPRSQSPWVIARYAVRARTMFCGERGGSVVECRTPEREVGGSKPTAAVLCP